MWKCARHMEAVEMDGEWIVMDAEKYVVTKLNAVGGWLYGRIRDGDGTEELVRGMTAEYGIDEDAARRDLLAFIDQLAEYGLIEHAS